MRIPENSGQHQILFSYVIITSSYTLGGSFFHGTVKYHVSYFYDIQVQLQIYSDLPSDQIRFGNDFHFNIRLIGKAILIKYLKRRTYCKIRCFICESIWIFHMNESFNEGLGKRFHNCLDD